MAWSHTTSTAYRYGLFKLALPDMDSTAYKIDDQIVAMKRKVTEVEVRDEKEQDRNVKHTLDKNEYGPIVDLCDSARH